MVMKCVVYTAVVVQLLSHVELLQPRELRPGSSVHGISQARIWSELPFSSPGDLPDSVIEPTSPA